MKPRHQPTLHCSELLLVLCKIYSTGCCPDGSLVQVISEKQKWVWTEECDSGFQTCKEMLTSKAVLVHYDSNRPIKLVCDAHLYGPGAVLSHVFEYGEHLVAFASCSLTKAENNYSQIEKEDLALTFGIKNFTNTSLVDILR